ncbi:MAG: hypothetical protein ACI39H_09635 [Lachnospiraceae bacterium]
MKISNSSIAMSSTHQASTYTQVESMTMTASASKDLPGAILSLSEDGQMKSKLESMKEYQEEKEKEAKQKRQENETKSLKMMAEQLSDRQGSQFKVSDKYDMQIRMLKRILAALRGERLSQEELKKMTDENGVTDLRSPQVKSLGSFSISKESSLSIGASATIGVSGAVGSGSGSTGDGRIVIGTTSAGTMWQRVTATSGFTTEQESTTFASQGLVQTEDGRSISFNVEVSMSRAFTAKIDSLSVQNYIFTDPLIINMDSNVGSVSDQKFFFDLDSDGTEEEVSFAGAGSGFLALDKNGDGKINDGSELFGTASGDGFKDLAQYDEDGNGWIDENDSIFSQLKVWIKDEAGNDQLLDLKKADVGAIYLGSADTEFSLKDDQNQTNGVIRRTGVYLKESTGSVGTINHVDLAV